MRVIDPQVIGIGAVEVRAAAVGADGEHAPQRELVQQLDALGEQAGCVGAEDDDVRARLRDEGTERVDVIRDLGHDRDARFRFDDAKDELAREP